MGRYHTKTPCGGIFTGNPGLLFYKSKKPSIPEARYPKRMQSDTHFAT